MEPMEQTLTAPRKAKHVQELPPTMCSRLVGIHGLFIELLDYIDTTEGITVSHSGEARKRQAATEVACQEQPEQTGRHSSGR